MLSGHLQIKNGRYYVVIEYKDELNRRKQAWRATGLSAHNNKKKAEKCLSEIRRNFKIPESKCKNEQMVLKVGSDILVSEYFEYWLEVVKNTLSPSTFGNYNMVMKRKVIPFFEKLGVTLENLSSKHILMYSSENSKKVSPTTVARDHTIIHTALQFAVENDMIDDNPCNKIKKPKKNTFNPEYYTAEEVDKLFRISSGSKYGLIIQMTVFYGLRRSEVLGLRWKAIDFTNNKFTINHTVIQTATENGVKEVMKKDGAKNKSSVRSYPLTEHFKNELLAKKKEQQENRKICGNCYNMEDAEYVFVDSMGDLIKPDTLSGGFKKLLEDNNMKVIRFHDLRHSCASMMLANGVQMKYIQEWLGHSDINTTANIYSHLDFSAKVMSAVAMENLLDIPETHAEGNWNNHQKKK